MVEVIVVSTMTFLLLLGLYNLLIAGSRFARETEAHATAQQWAHRLTRALVRELGASVRRYSFPQPESVWFLSAEPPYGETGNVEMDPVTGKLIWKKWVCYYRTPAERTVYRSEIKLTNAPYFNLNSPPQPDVELTSFQAPSVQKLVVGRGITAFEVTVGQYMDVEVEALATAAVAARQDTSKDAKIRLTSRVWLLPEIP